MIVSYQGRVTSGNSNFTGRGEFKFALVNRDPTTFWSNDGTSVNGSEPTSHVNVAVNEGLFTALLGQDMRALQASMFANENLRLRIWFNDGVNGFAQLVPDQLLTTATFAMLAATVQDGAITTEKIAPGAVGPAQISSNAVGLVVQIPDHLELGDANSYGSLSIFHTGAGTPSLILHGDGPQVQLFDPANQETVRIATLGSGGYANFYQSNGAIGVRIDGDASNVNGGGAININRAGGGFGLYLDGDDIYGAGAISVRDTDGSETVTIFGNAPNLALGTPSNGGGIDLRDASSTARVRLRGEGGSIQLTQLDGDDGVFLTGQGFAGGGLIRLRQADDDLGVILEGGTAGGRIDLFSGNATSTIALQAGGGDATLAGGGLLRLGSASGANLVFDGNEIMARNNAAQSTLYLNADGGRVVIGANQGATGYRLSVNGAVICSELVVQEPGDWPDYVFADDYELRPLEDLESSIREHRHLPGVPSAAEVRDGGVSLGAMQARLLEKVEELTLYILEQNRRLKAQEAELVALRERLEAGTFPARTPTSGAEQAD